MFYHGGMTLGYLTPPAAKEKKAKTFDLLSIFAKKPVQPDTVEDQERDREVARAFLTPWHLFY